MLVNKLYIKIQENLIEYSKDFDTSHLVEYINNDKTTALSLEKPANHSKIQ